MIFKTFQIFFSSLIITTSFLAGALMQSYESPSFIDNERKAKIQRVLPEIDQMYKEYSDKNHFPGFAYGIVVDGQLLYAGSSGFVDLDQKIPITSKSMFRIASMTKSFTAMAILKLRDDNKLTLDDPVSLYIPELKNQKLTEDSPEITIRDLLTHVAGFPSDDPWADRKLHENEQNFITTLKNGIYFSNVPETTYEYSNLGYTMLGYIINKITGISYQKYIVDFICKPLGIEDIAWEFDEVLPNTLVQGYKWDNENWKSEELLHDGIYGAMGGMICSIESFSRYVAFHLLAWPPRNDSETGPIKRSSIRQMHQPWRFMELITNKHFDGSESAVTKAYGFGLWWSKDSKGTVFVGHDGGLPGFGSNWTMMPEYGLGIVSFANVTYAHCAKVNMEILNKILASAELMPRQSVASHILKQRKNDLVSLLPGWENATDAGIFAHNFFLDHSLEKLQIETMQLFSSIGKITAISDVIPENQLRGHFIITGEKNDLHVKFSLTPENPSLIQEFQIKLVENFQ